MLQTSVCDEQLMSIGGEIALSGNKKPQSKKKNSPSIAEAESSKKHSDDQTSDNSSGVVSIALMEQPG